MTPIVVDKQKYYKRKDEQCDASTLDVKELSSMMQEILTVDRSKLRKFNRMSSGIEKKLMFQYLQEVECCNTHLGKG